MRTRTLWTLWIFMSHLEAGRAFLFSRQQQQQQLVESLRVTKQNQNCNKRRPIAQLNMMSSNSQNKKTKERQMAFAKQEEEQPSQPPPSSSDAGWLLTLCLPLWLVYVSNQWSRSSIYYLVDFSENASAFKAMNIDIGFSETQYGFLASVAFTSLFAIASLGAGAASDRFNRKLLTIGSALSWSAATLGTAMAESYTQVVLCRIAMGLACAFSTPTGT